MSDLLLTWMSGPIFVSEPGVKVFIESAAKVLPSAHKVVLTNEETWGWIPEDWKARFEVVQMQNDVVRNVLRDRWYAFWRYISDVGESLGLTHVFISDCKDVLFQEDIFDAIKKGTKGEEGICLFSEGMAHKDSQFNLVDQFKFQLGLGTFDNTEFKEWPVLNGGTVFGTRKVIENFCMFMWLASLRSEGKYTDQAAINFLANHIKVYIGDPRLNSLVVTGEGVKHGYVDVYNQDGTFFSTADKKPYCVFHQWDRTEFAPAILERYQVI